MYKDIVRVLNDQEVIASKLIPSVLGCHGAVHEYTRDVRFFETDSRKRYADADHRMWSVCLSS